MEKSLYQQHIEARDELYALADAAAERGDGIAVAEYIRIGRMEDEAAQEELF